MTFASRANVTGIPLCSRDDTELYGERKRRNVVAHIRRSCVRSSGIGNEQPRISLQRGSGSERSFCFGCSGCVYVSKKRNAASTAEFFGLDLWWLAPSW